jgi:hypothetical protein
MSQRGANVLLLVALVGLTAPIRSDASYPFICLAPEVVAETSDRLRLDAGDAVVKVLPARDRQLAVSAVRRVSAPADRLVAWMQRIDRFQQGRYIPQIRRFSDPPRLADLDDLVLDAKDIAAIRECRPGQCGVKLSAAEIATLRGVSGASADADANVQHAFRQLVLRRVNDYLTRGEAGIPAYHDDPKPLDPNASFAALVDSVASLPQQFAPLAAHVRSFPHVEDPHVVDSFVFWSKETLGGRPITSVTHVTIARYGVPPHQDAIVVSRQLFATHYKNASLVITAMTGSAVDGYLVYVHRSELDVLHGLFGRLVRRVIERRIRAEAPAVLDGFRRRLESGDPK